jgi:hypothetical protein
MLLECRRNLAFAFPLARTVGIPLHFLSKDKNGHNIWETVVVILLNLLAVHYDYRSGLLCEPSRGFYLLALLGVGKVGSSFVSACDRNLVGAFPRREE